MFGYRRRLSGDLVKRPVSAWARQVGGLLLVPLAGAMLVHASSTSHDASAMKGDHHHAQSSLPPPAATGPEVVVKPVSSEKLPNVPGKNITTVIVEFPPGGFSPEHHHAGSVTVYVLSGTIRSQLAGGPPVVYNAGETFFEPPGTTHLFAENVSATESAKILAVFVADEGAQLTTYH